jgi:uncharacterized SAM-binding protein YcdF (DUF218 family)
LSGSAERLTEIPQLARQFPKARIVFSGGNPALIGGGGPPEAIFAEQLWESFGIPRERIEIEDRSRDTAENATDTKALVKPKPGERWLLVTSALHMPRAMGAFRKVGISVEAYPADWHSRGDGGGWEWLHPSLSPVRGWGMLDIASKEWIGLFVYWLTGRSEDLFPGPEPVSVSPAAASPGDKRP